MQRRVYTPLCLHIVPQADVAPASLRESFMETVDVVLLKRKSWDVLLERILMPVKPEKAKWLKDAKEFWDSLSINRQRQIYYTLGWKKKRGVPIDEDPLYALKDCHPVPTNWNGRQGINDLMKTEKMVSAKYGEKYGIYTALEAKIFEMTDVKPLNF